MAHLVAERGIRAVFSYAGRVDRPRVQPVPVRVGGFGGADGLAAYLRAEKITHVIDASHPFAAQMSQNAVVACANAELPLVALSRPVWEPVAGDRWSGVADIDAAVASLAGAPQRVMLALGRMHLAAFAGQPQHHYLLRLVDKPETIPLPFHDVVVSRGPFTVENDIALMKQHNIQLVVSKNAGGTGARAKLDAARELGIPVVMIARPALPERPELASPAEVLDWIAHTGTDLGV